MRIEAATKPSAHREIATLTKLIWRECYADLLPAGRIDMMLADGYDSSRLATEQ